MSKRNTRAAKTPRRAPWAPQIRDFGLKLLAVRLDDEMVTHGTIALYVSAHGMPFTHRGTVLPHPGDPFKCFANAQRAAREHGLGYAEGFAAEARAGCWTLHAWNLDGRHVIDPTWQDDPGKRGHYFGITFGDLPDGEEAGISLLSRIVGGKLVAWDRQTGRVDVMDPGATTHTIQRE